jgi:hypothetical protein
MSVKLLSKSSELELLRGDTGFRVVLGTPDYIGEYRTLLNIRSFLGISTVT